MKTVFISWTPFQRRQKSFCAATGSVCIFLPPKRLPGSRVLMIFPYLANMVRTIRTLLKEKPSVLWIQLPQFPLLWAALLYKWLCSSRIIIVADCHNVLFRPPWSRVPLGLSALRLCSFVVVHNEQVKAQQAWARTVDSRWLVLEDVPPSVSAPTLRRLAISGEKLFDKPRPWIVFPASFGTDEPIRELCDAAEILQKGTIFITGRPELLVRHGLSREHLAAMIVLTGYLSVEDFDSLLCASDLVLGLTTTDDIQLSVCNEAIGYGRPLAVSGTSLLKRMFAEEAFFVDSTNSNSLARDIQLALEQKLDLEARSRDALDRRIATWHEKQYTPISARIAAAAHTE